MTRPLPSMRRRKTVSKADRTAFLDRLGEGWTVTDAAKSTGHLRQRLYEIRADDPEFAKDWDDALEAGNEAIEGELLRYATEGWTETDEVYDQEGNLVRRTTRQRRDPRILARLLEFRKPPLQKVEVAGALQHELSDQSASLEDIARVLEEAGAIRRVPTLDDLVRLGSELGVLPEYELVDVVDSDAVEVPRERMALSSAAPSLPAFDKTRPPAKPEPYEPLSPEQRDELRRLNREQPIDL